MASVTVAQTKFNDIDLSMTQHPVSGDVMLKKDVEAIKFAIKNILLTTYYPFHPEKQCRISDMLFDNYTQAAKSVAAREIQNTIINMEPRAILRSVTFGEDITNHTIEITVSFEPTNTTEQVSFTILLERLR